jgi:hypothetical protein
MGITCTQEQLAVCGPWASHPSSAQATIRDARQGRRLLKVVAHEPRHRAPAIVRRKIFSAAVGAGQEAPPQRAVRDDADAEIAARRHDVGLRNATRTFRSNRLPRGRQATMPMPPLPHLCLSVSLSVRLSVHLPACLPARPSFPALCASASRLHCHVSVCPPSVCLAAGTTFAPHTTTT